MWSKKYTECQKCKTTDKSYKCKGLCIRCYDKERYKSPKRKEYLKKSFLKHFLKNKDNKKFIETRKEDYKRYYEKKKDAITLAKKARYRKKNGLPCMIMRVNGIEYPLPFEGLNKDNDDEYLILKEYYENLQIKK